MFADRNTLETKIKEYTVTLLIFCFANQISTPSVRHVSFSQESIEMRAVSFSILYGPIKAESRGP